jgi:hypothetical protein
LSFIFAGYVALDTLINGRTPEGWATITVLILMLSGIQLIVLGMMGEYLWRVCEETRRRPLFLVQELTGAFPRIEGLSKRETCRENVLPIDHGTPSSLGAVMIAGGSSDHRKHLAGKSPQPDERSGGLGRRPTVDKR